MGMARIAERLGLPPGTRALRVSMVAELLGCSRAHVYKLMESGVLRRGRLAGTDEPRIPIEDVVKIAREAKILND